MSKYTMFLIVKSSRAISNIHKTECVYTTSFGTLKQYIINAPIVMRFLTHV